MQPSDLSFIGWLTICLAAALAWVAFPALLPLRRLVVSAGFAVLVALIMLNPPERAEIAPLAAPEPVKAPAAKAPEPASPAPAQAAPATKALAAAAFDSCAVLSGVEKEYCVACGGISGLTRLLCEAAAINRYCSDKTGKDPACPDHSAPPPDPA